MMLVCCPRARHLVALSFNASRSTSTSTNSGPATTSASQPAVKSQDSIFTAPESPWDHVFSDIEPVSPLLPSTQRLRTRLTDSASPTSPSGHKKSHGQTQSFMQRSSGVRRQRASLTAREMSVFDEMFDLIFNAVSAQGGKTSGSDSCSPARTSSNYAIPYAPSSSTPSIPGQTPGVGHAGAPLNDLFRTLRRHTSRVRWTTAIDEELDRKKETMELFNTDHELLQWVTMELFGESQQWDEEAKRAIAASSAGTAKEEGKGDGRSLAGASSADAAATSMSSSPSPLSCSSPKEHPINHSIYPHLIAHAMRIFRTTYSNPSLSLVIFQHAARVSIPSYVFGCTAPAYNELIEAKWEGWGDLEGVCNALEEMRANGVQIDGRTRIVVEKVRRQVGEARPVELGEPGLKTEENGHTSLNDAKGVNPLARRVWRELGEAEAMRLLHRIERLALRDRSRKSASSPHEESWKSAALQPVEDDGWSFNAWDREKRTGDTKKQRRMAQSTPRDKIHSQTPDDWTVLGIPEEETAFR
ncbi:hypothetical protein J3R82DRAFT_10186 [Butyriboletus roseoflavus]|nr:hypothetical protein J3R82DRAFT_10186 [Butyriboletus roseoflavus]